MENWRIIFTPAQVIRNQNVAVSECLLKGEIMNRKPEVLNAKVGKVSQLKHKTPHPPRRKSQLNPKAMIHRGV